MLNPMNIKQVFAVVALSAVTTFATLFTYNHFTQKPLAIQADNGKMPANYVGLFDSNSNNPGTQPIDFQQAAQWF